MPLAPIARTENAADPYCWLEKRDAEDVLEYLKAENTYLEAELAEQRELREALFQEIKARIRETDLSLPSPWGPWLYYQRTPPATNTRATIAARARPTARSTSMKAPSSCCSTPTPWRTAVFSRSAPSASARITSAWPTAWTPAATRFTSCSSRN